ncbi:MAG: flagellar basal body-associated FliL family protein [Chitinispirillales bacterium]|jgi:flagellar basal body-associated protein FliL|nr:flagellar basal body-associated FliL family protein [Chitinispirillales bacterium]
MAEDKQESAPAAGDDGKEKKGSNPLLLIGIVVGILAVQVVVVYFLVPKPVDEDAEAMRRMEDSLRVITMAATHMGAITDEVIEAVVNIAGTSGERFLKSGIVLEYDGRNRNLARELERRTPGFRDEFIRYMTRLTFAEVTEHGAQDKIAKDLLRVLNATLPTDVGEIMNVRFVSFVIQ